MEAHEKTLEILGTSGFESQMHSREAYNFEVSAPRASALAAAVASVIVSLVGWHNQLIIQTLIN